MMSSAPQTGSWLAGRVAFALAVLVAIVGLSGFIYSPWHQHDPVAPLSCPFTQFEKTAWTEDSAAAVVVEAAFRTVAVIEQSEPAAPEHTAATIQSTRAPPELSVNSLAV